MTNFFATIGFLSAAFVLCLLVSRSIIDGAVQRVTRHRQRLEACRPAWRSGCDEYRRSLRFQGLSNRVMER